jgi:hypothetical protein
MVIPANLLVESLLQNAQSRSAPIGNRNPVVADSLGQALGIRPEVFGGPNPNLQGLVQLAQTSNTSTDATQGDSTFLPDFLTYLHKVEGKGGGDRTSKKYDAITFPGGLNTHAIKTMGSKIVPELFVNDKDGKKIMRFKNRAQAEKAMKAGDIQPGFWGRQVKQSVGHYSKNIPNWDTLGRDQKIGALSHMWNLGPGAKFKSLFNILKADKPAILDIKKYISNAKSTGQFRRGTVNRRIKDINKVLSGKGHPIIEKVLYKNIKGKGTEMTFFINGKKMLNEIHNKKNRALIGGGKGYTFTANGGQKPVR